MFFPDLLNLKKRQVSDHDIEVLDWWLGTRRANTRKYLNPLQFSIDCRVDIDHAMKLFTICVLDSYIQLLTVRYVLKCPNCDSVLDKQLMTFDPSSLNGKRCCNCGYHLNKKELTDASEIYFTLLKTPEPIIKNISDAPFGVDKGNTSSLQGSMLRDIVNKDDDLGRLFSCLDFD